RLRGIDNFERAVGDGGLRRRYALAAGQRQQIREVAATGGFSFGPQFEPMDVQGRNLRRPGDEIRKTGVALSEDLVDFGEHGRGAVSCLGDSQAANLDAAASDAASRADRDVQTLIVA